MRKEDIAKYAYDNVSFYTRLKKDNWETWDDYPIIDKQTILEHMDSMFAPQYIADLYANNLEHVLTSGSTGDCLDVFWKRSQNIKSLIPLWNRRKNYYGISPDDRRCYFFTTKMVNGEELEIEESKFGLGFSKIGLSEKKIVDIYNRMLTFDPRWMIIQPSMLLLLVSIAKKMKLQPLPNLSYIELTGERILDNQRQAAKKFFDCEIASQYGCYEVNSIAYECPYGSLHVMSENVYVENTVEDDICVTSLQNKVMPFIRYKIGDKGKVIQKNDCPCGCKDPVIELEKARENDWIYHADGTVSHSDLFCYIVEKINLMFEQIILQYQIVQINYNEFEIYLVLSEQEFSNEIKRLFTENYEIYQQKSDFTFYFVDYLYPSEKTGKVAWFTSKMRGEKEL